MNGKWIDIVPTPSDAKTKKFVVLTAGGGNVQLGEIKFYPKWRAYAFFPFPRTLYEQDCLRDIATFCEIVTKEWRLEVRQRKAARQSPNDEENTR